MNYAIILANNVMTYHKQMDLISGYIHYGL